MSKQLGESNCHVSNAVGTFHRELQVRVQGGLDHRRPDSQTPDTAATLQPGGVRGTPLRDCTNLRVLPTEGDCTIHKRTAGLALPPPHPFNVVPPRENWTADKRRVPFLFHEEANVPASNNGATTVPTTAVVTPTTKENLGSCTHAFSWAPHFISEASATVSAVAASAYKPERSARDTRKVTATMTAVDAHMSEDRGASSHYSFASEPTEQVRSAAVPAPVDANKLGAVACWSDDPILGVGTRSHRRKDIMPLSAEMHLTCRTDAGTAECGIARGPAFATVFDCRGPPIAAVVECRGPPMATVVESHSRSPAVNTEAHKEAIECTKKPANESPAMEPSSTSLCATTGRTSMDSQSKIYPERRPGKPPGRPPPSKAPPPSRSNLDESIQAYETAAPFSKRLHLKQSYQTPTFTTVFGGQDSAPLDLPLLNALFSGHQHRHQVPRLSVKRKDCISTLDFRRALGIEIALSKARISTQELSACLQTLDLNHSRIHLDDIERLLGKMPTAEESELLLLHAGAPETLRHLEQQLLPLCYVADAERRLGLLHIGLSHATQCAQLMKCFECISCAAAEVLASARLHNILRYCLQIANYINHGRVDGAKTFSVASFSAFAAFRLGNSSALHYLCLTMCDAAFMRGLKADLEHVFQAARESTDTHNEEMQAFCAYSTEAEAHIATEPDRLARARAAELFEALTSEQEALLQAQQIVRLRAEEAQRFLGERATVLAKSEAFFAHIVGVVRHLELALAEVEQNPQRWHDLAAAMVLQVPTAVPAQPAAPYATSSLAGALTAGTRAITPASAASPDHGVTRLEAGPEVDLTLLATPPREPEAVARADPGRRKHNKRISVLADGLSVQSISGAVNSGAVFPVE